MLAGDVDAHRDHAGQRCHDGGHRRPGAAAVAADVPQRQPHRERQPAGRCGRPARPGWGRSRRSPALRWRRRTGSRRTGGCPAAPTDRPRRTAACRRPAVARASPTRALLVRTTPRRPLNEATTGARAAPRAGSQAEATAVAMPTAKAPTSSINRGCSPAYSWPARFCASGSSAQAATSPRPSPRTPATAPSTTAPLSTTPRTWPASPPVAASSARSRWERRAPTPNAAPAMSTASSRARPVTRTVRPVLMLRLPQRDRLVRWVQQALPGEDEAPVLARPG